MRIAVPSKGRIRDQALDLLRDAGYRTGGLNGRTSATEVDDLQFIEMRPTDAAVWLAAGHLDAAFISTDTALEAGCEDFPTVELGYARSDLVIACRDAAPFQSPADLAGKTLATHMPNFTTRWFAERDIDVDVIRMGGSLEGVCAVGLADAIVDLRETGSSLARNRLRVLDVFENCQATFANHPECNFAIADVLLRLHAALDARNTQYVMLHIPADHVDALSGIFSGLESPTVLPLAGRDDLVAAHMVVGRSALWKNLGRLREIGATGIVALPNDALVD